MCMWTKWLHMVIEYMEIIRSMVNCTCCNKSKRNDVSYCFQWIDWQVCKYAVNHNLSYICGIFSLVVGYINAGSSSIHNYILHWNSKSDISTFLILGTICLLKGCNVYDPTVYRDILWKDKQKEQTKTY